MKLKIFILLCFIQSVNATAFSQEQKLDVSFNNELLVKVIDYLQDQTGMQFFYLDKNFSNSDRVSVKMKQATLSEILDKVLKSRGYTYEVLEGVVSIRPTTVNEQEKKKSTRVKGWVVDDKKHPLPGVTVRLTGVSLGTATNAKGWFAIDLPVEKGKLEFSFVGFKKKFVDFTEKTDTLRVVMEEDQQQVEEVVVTGIFTKAKESFTGAATLITKEELKEFKSRNILQTISSIDPSFNIIRNNKFGSDPNKLPEINIRGTTSIPSNIEDLQEGERANLNTPLFILDGFEISLERMMDLDPEEIESVTLLKDASSTAIYGSRGSNGVVVLTTVKPEAGKLQVSIGGNLNLEIPDLSSYNVLNAREKLEIERLAGYYIGKNTEEELKLRDLYSEKLQAVEEGVDTYWLSKPLQTGVGQNYRLSMSGGDPAFRYSLSASYDNTVGVMKGSHRDNFNGSVNIAYYRPKISFSNNTTVGLNSSANSKYGAFNQYVDLNPYWRLYGNDGNMIKVFGQRDIVTDKVKNPMYATQVDMRDESHYTSLRNTTSVEWKPVKSLRIGFRAGITKQMAETDLYKPGSHVDFEFQSDITKKGSYNYSNTSSRSWELSLNLSYAKVIEKHSIFVGLNGDMRESSDRNYRMAVTGFVHDRLDFISMGSQYQGDVPSGSESTTRSMGMVTNVNYNYASALFVDASYRVDGASSFGEHGRFRSYYSVGAGWTISQLNWFKEHVDWLSTWRVRYNYGMTGSLQFSNPYQAMTVYEYDMEKRFDGHLGAYIMGYGNPDLSWQYTYSHNLGTDITVLNGKFSFGLNVYRRKTEGMTTSMKLPLSHGYANYTENRGDVRNEGIDANVSIRLLQRSGISWSVRASIAQNRNKILKLSSAMKELSKAAEAAGRDDPNYLYREGESMDALYVVPSLGIDPNTGNEVFVDQRGRPTYVWQGGNRRSYGVSQPKVNGRFSTSVRYKGLSMTAGFSVRLGGQQYNSTLVSKVENAKANKNVDKRVFSERWKKPGDFVKYKALNPGKNSSGQSSRFVQDESTLELMNLSISYNFGRKILKYLHLKGGSISMRMNDVFYVSTVKQERGTSYPFSYKPNFSLSLTF